MSNDGERVAHRASSRTIARNGFVAATQVALTSIGFLIAYRIIGGSVGIPAIGAWTLCLALGSLACIFDFGISDGMVRTVAQRAASEGSGGIRQALVTGIVFCVLGCAIGAAICYSLLDTLVPLLTSDATTRETMRVLLLPAIVVAAINALSLSCMGVLEGLEKYGLRFLAGTASTLAFVAAVALLVPRLGLNGLILGYLAQSGTALGFSMFLCLRLTPARNSDSSRVSLTTARELLVVGFPLRATGLVTFALDPFTRVAATFFGGTLAAGHYEVASRFVMQLRALIVAAFQAGLPRLVKLRASEHSLAAAVETELHRAGVVLSVGAFTMAALLSPVIYVFILGNVPQLAMSFFLILCGGWCVNAISAPFFFSLISQRRGRTIATSSGLMALINVPLAWLLGTHFGAIGVVAGLAVAIAAGSAFTIVAGLRSDGRPIPLPRARDLTLPAVSIAALAVAFGPGSGSPEHVVAYARLIPVTLLYALTFAVIIYRAGILQR